MSETPVLVELQTKPTLSIRGEISIQDIARSHGERLQRLWEHLKQHQLVPAGPPFVRYHTFGDERTDVEVGVPLVHPAAGSGNLQAGHLPGGLALVTEHDGPHRQLGRAYQRLQQAMQERGLHRDGPAWEVYNWMALALDTADRSDVASDRGHTTLVQPLKQP
ncbi:GyrI-like domain-containing protein [Deinococcus cellulosilyticus]|uniref:Transcription activator effector-binding protein n=1 Tax=Deinococcus cellulosilyticus (strain DSM 18568 / NBRC 106333 / KACC 11606 / 5516J-15) TaxID=1223518 RepID=A0A511N7D6_DEIC1|nr:GyrI-like domain-containing protein [Deinococcus cellulosilyticus]GEM48376.1 transcription activator effector-binding protein [Deinococcus cellulosilyticus NBRC 106333 = KACC 11606]